MRHTLIALLAATAVASASCGPAHSGRYSRKAAQTSLKKLEEPGLVLGEFTLTKVTDGDTVRVDGLDSSLRLLGMDTEEIFHNNKERRAFEVGWDQYLINMRGKSKHPVKMSTPVGEDGKKFAESFMTVGDKVRIERDDPRQIRDRYNRYLAYVFVMKNGKWVNYNVECVRAGWSPYFMKYGYSRRFDQEFRQAQDEARAAKRGIWQDGTQHYPDYPERLAWWTARGDFVAEFAKDAAGHDDFIDLTDWDSLDRIENHLGKQVTLLGTIGDIRLGDRGPTRVMLSRQMHSDFPLVFFDKDVFGNTHLDDYKGEFIRARGTVTEYTNKHTGRTNVQIVIDRPSQITLPTIPGIDPPTVGGPATP